MSSKKAKPLALSATLGQPDRPRMIQGMTDVGRIEWAGADWFMLYRSIERTLVAQCADLKRSEVTGLFKVLAERVPAPE